jgi:hypothetical protein
MADIFSWFWYLKAQVKRRNVTSVPNELALLVYFCRLLDIVVYRMCTYSNIAHTVEKGPKFGRNESWHHNC